MEEDNEFVVPDLCGAQEHSEEDAPKCQRERGHEGSHLSGNDWTVWDSPKQSEGALPADRDIRHAAHDDLIEWLRRSGRLPEDREDTDALNRAFDEAVGGNFVSYTNGWAERAVMEAHTRRSTVQAYRDTEPLHHCNSCREDEGYCCPCPECTFPKPAQAFDDSPERALYREKLLERAARRLEKVGGAYYAEDVAEMLRELAQGIMPKCLEPK